MPACIGIEISPAACRIVQIERPGNDEDAETIVRAFAVTSSADEATLAPYRGQEVALVMWGLHAEHRQAVVTAGWYQRMRREAVTAAREAGVDTRQMLADIAPVAVGTDRDRRRPVVVALARTSEVAAAVHPLTSAGLKVRSVVTPALAMMSLARLRRRFVPAGMAEAYVALEETATAIALVRDGALIAARELNWGYLDEQGQVRSRVTASEVLAAAIEDFFGDCGALPSAVAQVCVCGGMPELRSMTLALTQRLDVEIEPLDSLFAIDANHLPSADFRDRAADLRLAWAAAADWDAPINFLRERRRRQVKTTLRRAAVVAGVATGLGIAWRVQQSGFFEPSKPPTAKPSATVAAASRPRPAPPRPAPSPIAPRSTSPPPAVPPPAARAVVAPPPAPVAAAPPKVIATAPVKPVAQPPVTPPSVAQRPVATQPPASQPHVAQAPVAKLPVAQPPVAIARTPPPVILTPVPEPARPAPARDAQAPVTPPISQSPAPSPAARQTRRQPAEEVPLPFEGTLGTILYGADRKLAIIDGQIVQVGDDVRGARVIEITPNSVFFRDRQGRLRRLGLENLRK